MGLKVLFPKVQVYSEPQNMTVFGNGSLQMMLDEIDHIVIGWVITPRTFVLIRGERLRYTGRKTMWKQAEEGVRQLQTQKHREPLEAGVGRKGSPLQTWEQVWPTDPWILDLQPPQLRG